MPDQSPAKAGHHRCGGFKSEQEIILASVRAYREGRHGSESGQTAPPSRMLLDLFRFRVIPGITVATDMRILCGGQSFEITSVEDVKGRGMYVEALAREVKPSG